MSVGWLISTAAGYVLGKVADDLINRIRFTRGLTFEEKRLKYLLEALDEIVSEQGLGENKADIRKKFIELLPALKDSYNEEILYEILQKLMGQKITKDTTNQFTCYFMQIAIKDQDFVRETDLRSGLKLFDNTAAIMKDVKSLKRDTRTIMKKLKKLDPQKKKR
ncbi:MAG: hypothetical protein LBC12_03715 [Nitrososphaerota archaeon]|jgi:hypothetical protein|nr:hypothetical protein [Nitrososphaerota archaeon]